MRVESNEYGVAMLHDASLHTCVGLRPPLLLKTSKEYGGAATVVSDLIVVERSTEILRLPTSSAWHEGG